MDADTQKWIGPDEKVRDMTGLYEALVEALRSARSEGEEEAHAEEEEAHAEVSVASP